MFRQHAQAAYVIALLAILAGCVSFGGPKTVPEALALNYATIESLSDSAAQSLQAGSISVDKAKNIRDILEQAYAVNKMAETAYNTGASSDASSYLQMTSALLTQLEGML